MYKDKFVDCPLKEPTLALFLYYYYFGVEKCWIKVVRRRWGLFEPINNAGKWQNGFFFVSPTDAVFVPAGGVPIRMSWNQTRVTLPGRKILNDDELKALRIIEQIKIGKYFGDFVIINIHSFIVIAIVIFNFESVYISNRKRWYLATLF